MELDELHVGDPAAGAPGHGDAVAGGGVGVAGVQVDLAGAAGGQHDAARARRSRPGRVRGPGRRRPGSDCPRGPSFAAVIRSMAIWCSNSVDIGACRAPAVQRDLDGPAGGIGGMDDPAVAMTAFARQMVVQACRRGVCSRVKGTPRSISQRIASGRMFYGEAHDLRSHRPAPAIRVSSTCDSKESSLSSDRGNPALGIKRGAFLQPAPLDSTAMRKLRGQAQRQAQSGAAAADDQYIERGRGAHRLSRSPGIEYGVCAAVLGHCIPTFCAS